MPLVREVFLLPLTRQIETAIHDERRDGVKLAGVQERSMPAAHIDDRPRDASEIEAIHHLATNDAAAVAYGRGSCGERPGRTPAFEHRRLRLSTYTHPIEIGGTYPDPVTARALEDRQVAEHHLCEVAVAAWTDAG